MQQPADQGQGVIQGDIVLPAETVDAPKTSAPTSHPKASNPKVTNASPPAAQKALLEVETKASKAKAASKVAAKAGAKGAKNQKAQKKGTASSVAAAGKHYIQLASLENATQAKQEWKRLSTRNKDVLGKLKPTITKAELEGGRVFYRLRAGGFSRNKAQDLCKKLRSRKVGCLVINP
jgi:hypothetical protein